MTAPALEQNAWVEQIMGLPISIHVRAVATSGSAHRGHHIIDPHSKRPASASRAVTVAGPTLLWADVYATAAVARGSTAVAWLDGIDDYEGLVVRSGSLLPTTAGWPGRQ